ncbi:intracellular hyaluronan-binding protein 4 isoform X2 [Protopterus annectens]|uniref:intracellular hyaluronan-binding protein 4 isoform X2 n=1 Tax=Protopterus annectens TaxID=7888 RepID=UPI001CFB4B9E|nr:intracellular hyaluronan-binding protein 4 isoform X2 [Protopterus annectens]
MMMMMRNSMSATMQDGFGCAVTNRFMQLLDDESDPFDILREAEEEKRKKKKKEEAAAGKKGGAAAASKTGKKESQRDRRLPVSDSNWAGPAAVENSVPPQQLGQKRGFRKGEQQGLSEYRPTEIKNERIERRPVFREQRTYDEGSAEFGIERPVDRLERPMRGRGRGGMRGRGRGGPPPRNVDGFDQRGKRDFERHSGSDRTEIEQNAVTAAEEPAEAKTTEVPEGDAENKEGTGDAEGEDHWESEMSLDEWKMLQLQSKPKAEFNIRKPDASVLKKAVVIHKSKFKDGLKIEDEDDDEDGDHHYLRRPVNDITSQLDINFGSLSRPGRGGRGRGRGGRGRDRRVAETRPEILPELPQGLAPDPYDPEAFPALA